MSDSLTQTLDPDFAAHVAHKIATDPGFFALYGMAMDVDLCADPSVQWTIKAAQAIYRDARSAPGGEYAIMQRLQLWVDAGTCPRDILDAVEDDFDHVGEGDTIPSAVLGSELRTVLQRHKRHQLVQDILKAHGRDEDLTRQAKALLDVGKIGLVRETSSADLADAPNLLRAAANLERLPTGIEELDNAMKGGPPRQSLSLWIGGTGDGKSIALSMVSAVALMLQRNVVYISLEIPTYMVLARISAALTGFSIDDFEAVDDDALRALDEAMTKVGSLDVEYMEPGVTTVGDIDEYIDRVEQARGEAVEFLAVDYLDRLAAPGKRGSKRGEISTYSTGEIVTTQLRDSVILPRNLWGHTASAAKGQRAGKKAVKGTDDGADSLHKARISDNVITLNMTEGSAGERHMLLKCAKHRTGKAGFTVGPYPTEFARGLVVKNSVLDGTGQSDQLWSTVF